MIKKSLFLNENLQKIIIPYQNKKVSMKSNKNLKYLKKLEKINKK